MSDIDEKEVKKTWFRHPIIHFPLWLCFAFIFVDFIGEIGDLEAVFVAGIFIFVTGIWEMTSKIFFLRIPYLGRFIYINNYITSANIIIIALGITTAILSIVFSGTSTIENFIELFKNKYGF